MARIIYPRVAVRLGRPIMIENRGGAEPRPMTPDEFAAFFAAERRKWTSLIREANITLE